METVREGKKKNDCFLLLGTYRNSDDGSSCDILLI